jgi:uncharacterized membrane protein (DUF485 family)
MITCVFVVIFSLAIGAVVAAYIFHMVGVFRAYKEWKRNHNEILRKKDVLTQEYHDHFIKLAKKINQR